MSNSVGDASPSTPPVDKPMGKSSFFEQYFGFLHSMIVVQYQLLINHESLHRSFVSFEVSQLLVIILDSWMIMNVFV